MTIVAAKGNLAIPVEELVWADGKVRLKYVSVGARVSTMAPGKQLKPYDPYKVAIVQLESDDYAVVAWGGGGRNHANHSVILSEKIVKVSAWRPSMSQVITESGLTVSWSKSSQCGSCGGIPAPKNSPWPSNPVVTPGAFDPTKLIG